MPKLLMITGDRSLAQGKMGAFFNTMEEFRKHWERVDIICPRSKAKGQKLNIRPFENVFIHPSPWFLIFQPLFILWKGRLIFKKIKYDVMTVHEYPPFYNGLGASLLSRDTGVPYMLEIHHIPGYPRSSGLKEQIYLKLSEFYLKYDSRQARAVRIVNQNQLAGFLAMHGVPLEKTVFIPSLYIDLDIFKPMAEPKKYDLIFVGRLAVNKGIFLFLEAAITTGARAVIVGSGPLEKPIEDKIEKLGVGDRIRMYGWAKDQQEVAMLINQSRVMVMLSYNEGNPRVVVEAMACGVPVVATPVGIVPDLIENGRSGQMVSWDGDDVARKISDILSDDRKYAICRQAGLEIAKGFEKKEAIKNYARAVKRLIKL